MGLRRIKSSAKSKAGEDLPEPQPHTFMPVVTGPSPGLLQSAQANLLFCLRQRGCGIQNLLLTRQSLEASKGKQEQFYVKTQRNILLRVLVRMI